MTKYLSSALASIIALAALGCSEDSEPADDPSGGMAGSSSMGQAGSGGGMMFTERGVCGQKGESPVVNATTFGDGFEEYYLLSDRGFGPEICIVRFPVTRLGEAPPGCTDCLWSHLVGFGEPTIVMDNDGVCARSELGMDDARMNEIASSTAAYGFVSEFSGHNSVLLKYETTAAETWGEYGNATWNPDTSEFTFNKRDGECRY